ncbi:MAG: ribonuclease H-like domain-containing protein [Candidatus Gottesmanbacteria bacterium]
MITELIFDVETKKLFSDITTDDPGELGVSVVSVYRRTLNTALEEIEGEMRSFWEKDFFSMWPWFVKADRIIGFNSLKFDVPALRPYAPVTFSTLKHFDIMELVRQKLGRRIGLSALTKDTLGNEKTDVGTNAVIYWTKGDPVNLRKLQTYCEADVVLTRDLYDFGRKNKYLKYRDKWNNIVTIDIDFSYPIKKEEPQIGLF